MASAASRRVGAWWRRLADRDQPLAVEAAVHWLSQHADVAGLAGRPAGPRDPGTVADFLPTLLEFGQRDLLRSGCAWLLSTQRADGGFSCVAAGESSPMVTARSLGALVELTSAGIIADSEPARRAAGYLAARLAAEVEVSSRAIDAAGQRLRAAIQLLCLPPLLAASRQLNAPDWRLLVDRVAARAKRAIDWHSWNESSRLWTQSVEAWIALGEIELAREMMRWPAIAQRRGGAVPNVWRGSWGDNEQLARLAAIWYKLGERRRADHAISFLTSRQLRNGGFCRRWGRAEAGESALTALRYLDAVHWQAASSFAGSPCDLPLTIDSDDGRLIALHDWMASLGPAAHVADVGCGPGRFLHALVRRRPAARLTGIDPASELLQHLPQGVDARRGGLLRIPARDGEFDGVFAVESLEHSLLPELAVNELCRVVRPGGRVLIIDKHSARQPLSLHQPWERWFLPETVMDWLAPHCRDIRVDALAHGPGGAEKGLFLCWQATRGVHGLMR